MTDKELLQQAVSLLNLIDDESICDASHHSLKDRHELGEACPILERHKNLFEAIRARLAQPEPEYKECRHCGFECRPNDNQSKKWYPLEQPEQRRRTHEASNL